MQMRLHMNHACESVIRLDQLIKFVCVVDENAKLLLGKSRAIPTHLNPLNTSETSKCPSPSNESKIDDLVETHLKYSNMYLFYLEYLSWVIKNCNGNPDGTKNKKCFSITHITNKFETSTFFELSGFDNDKVKLVVMPLNIRMRMFLCIYFAPSYGIKSSVADANIRFKILLRRINGIASLHSKTFDSV